MNTNSIQLTPDILALITGIDEFKGAWRALGNLAPEQLTALRQVATIESIGSSTRIEGSKLTDQEVERLLGRLHIQEFKSRDEEEVAGYAATMQLVFENYNAIPVRENYLHQLHQYLLQYSTKDAWHRGRYKTTPNHVEAFGPDGRSLGVVFETATPLETPLRMEALMQWTQQALETQQLHPLLITAIFKVVFLAIHPYQDGNGRLSRILTTWLLLGQGYAYVPYSSLESVIEHNKEGYYLALRQTQGTLKQEQPNWQPWLLYFLRALQQQKRRLAARLEREHQLLAQLPALQLQILELAKTRGRITLRDLVTLTGANRNTLKKHVETLTAQQRLKQYGVGKGTWYGVG